MSKTIVLYPISYEEYTDTTSKKVDNKDAILGHGVSGGTESTIVSVSGTKKTSKTSTSTWTFYNSIEYYFDLSAIPQNAVIKHMTLRAMAGTHLTYSPATYVSSAVTTSSAVMLSKFVSDTSRLTVLDCKFSNTTGAVSTKTDSISDYDRADFSKLRFVLNSWARLSLKKTAKQQYTITAQCDLKVSGVELEVEYESVAPTVKVKHDGVWLDGEIKCKVNGEWVTATSAYIKADGEWVKTS